MKKSSKLFL